MSLLHHCLWTRSNANAYHSAFSNGDDLPAPHVRADHEYSPADFDARVNANSIPKILYQRIRFFPCGLGYPPGRE